MAGQSNKKKTTPTTAVVRVVFWLVLTHLRLLGCTTPKLTNHSLRELGE